MSTALADCNDHDQHTWPSWHPMGHLPQVARDPLRHLELARARHPDLVWLRMAHLDTLHLFRPRHVKHVLVSHADRYAKSTRGYQILKNMLGDGLLTAEGDHWRRQRRIAQPAFRRGTIDGFATTMVRHTEQMMQRWDVAAERGEQIDVAEEMNRLTLRIACSTLFSYDIGPVEQVIGDAMSQITNAFDRLVTSALPPSWPTAANLQSKRAITTLDDVVYGIIDDRRSAGEHGHDLLGMLMSATYEDTGEGMSDRQLRDEVLTMLMAGHETTANALTFTLYLLSQHPAVASSTHQHVQEVLGDGTPGFSDYRALDGVGRVVQESMRLYPPVWIQARKALQDDTIDGEHVPAGTMVFLSPWAIQRHPALWTDPDVFDPDRWLPERSTNRHPLAWFPFGAGQRKCIGQHFALLETRLIISMLTRRYRLHLRPGHKLELETSVTLRAKTGLPMVLERRGT